VQKILGENMDIAAKLIALALALFAVPAMAIGEKVTLTHIHGMAYSADGKQLLVASHHGLAIYDDGAWSIGPGPRNDYMGFSATRKYLYSSGHPAPGSGAINPLGLVRSGDGGVKWDKLGLEGESDFHLLAAGYQSNAVFVYNQEPNRRMRTPGLYATLNDGFAWRHAEARGLEGKPVALAVHPTDTRMIAVASSVGLFLSTDGGDRFERLGGKVQALGVQFSQDGRQVWFSSHDGKPHLYRIDLGTRNATEVVSPPLSNDAIAFIAQNPASSSSYAIATFERSVFVTTDSGGRWQQIVERGRVKQ
jgi:hypothetical protein